MEIVTGLYTDVPVGYTVAPDGCLSLIINWVTVFSSKVIVSSPIKIEPVFSHPRVDETLILLPVLSVPASGFSSLVLVEIANSPFTVSGASTIL